MEKTTRLNITSALVSGKGTGKSTYCRKAAEIALKQNKRVLVIDTIVSPVWNDVELIELTDLVRWKKGIKRVLVKDYELDFSTIANNVSNAMVICEDARKYAGSKPTKALVDLMIDSKQKNIDMMLVYHAWGWLPADMLRVLDYIVIGKTQDSPEGRKNYLGGAYSDCLAAYNKAQKSSNQFIKLDIDLQS
jgi:hypothetical protein